MINDRYTKSVLTVIAGSLLWLCAMRAGSPLAAQPASLKIANASVQPVVIVGTGTLDQQGTVTVNFTQQPGALPRTDPTVPVALSYSAAKPLPVSLPYSASNPLATALPYSAAAPLAVQVTSVKKAGDWEPIRVQVEDAPTRKTPGIPR